MADKKALEMQHIFKSFGGVHALRDVSFTAYEGKDTNPKEVIDLSETLPFFADRRVILIENSGFFKGSCEELAEYMPQVPDTTLFLFVEEEVDKRSKLYKAVKNVGKIVEFTTQTEELLTRWILTRLKKEGKNITGSVMQLFLSKTGTDMGNIDRELEKLICYCMDKDVIEAKDVEAVTTEQTTNKIFEMVNAIAEHNQRRALDLYYDLLTLKEPPMRIMYLITRQFQILLHLAGRALAGIRVTVDRQIHQHGIAGSQIQSAAAQSQKLLAEHGIEGGKAQPVIIRPAFSAGLAHQRLQFCVTPQTGEMHIVDLGELVKIQKFVVDTVFQTVVPFRDEPRDRARDPDRIKILEHRYPLVAFLHIEFIQELVGDDGGVDALFQMCIAEV